MISEKHRKITVVDRGDELLVIDARSGEQIRHRAAKQSDKITVATKHDLIVVDPVNLTHTVEPLPAKAPRERTKNPSRKPSNRCKHLGKRLPGEKFPPAEGLGDLFADALSAVGVTKERYAELKSIFVKENPDDCEGCNKRQNWLNWLGSKLKMPTGQGSVLYKVLQAETISKQPVNACAKFGKCLPRLKRDGETKAAIEAAGFHLCDGCESRELVQIAPVPPQSS